MYNSRYSWVINPSTTSPWAYHSGFFSVEECNKIIEKGLAQAYNEATISNDQTVDNKIRRNYVSFFEATDPDNKWFFERVNQAVKTINQQFWNMDVFALECLQFSIYNRIGDFYSTHTDMVHLPHVVRKLSISVQLSDPMTYSGSDLKLFRVDDTYDAAPRDQGTLIAFPSYHPHQVTPLLSGTRYSLVSWIIGPPFR